MMGTVNKGNNAGKTYEKGDHALKNSGSFDQGANDTQYKKSGIDVKDNLMNRVFIFSIGSEFALRNVLRA